MAGYGHLKYIMILTIPLDEEGDPPPAFQGIRAAWEAQVANVKGLCETVNEGKANQEIPFATYHICHHDTGGGCEESTEIE